MKRSGGGNHRFAEEDSFAGHADSSDAQPVRTIQQTLFHLGDKHPSLSRAEDLAISIDMLQSEYPKYSREILEALIVCIAELPHKLDVYVDLVGGLPSAVAVEIVQTIYEKLFLVAGGAWRHLIQALRFLAVTVAAESMEVLLQPILGHLNSPNDQEALFPAWLLLAALPWIRKGSEDLFNRILTQIPAHLCPEMYSLIESLNIADIPTIPRAALALNVSLITTTTFLTPDSLWQGASLARTHPTIFPDTFDREPAIQILVYEQLTQLAMSFELNHRRLADALLAAISGWSEWGHPEKMLAEWIFGEQLLREQGETGLVLFKRAIGWQVVLGNCCRQSRHFPPILARAIFALTSPERITQVGWVQLDRLARYFALHLTSFDFKWPWDEWAHLTGKEAAVASVEGTVEFLQLAFIKIALEELARLSYPDRLREVLPGWLQPFLPAGLGESFEVSNGGEQDEGSSLVKAIKEHRGPAHVEAILDEQQFMDRKAGIVKAMLTATAGGSLSHCQTCIESYLGLLQKIFLKTDSFDSEIADRASALGTIVAFWEGKSRLHVEYWFEKMVHYRLISPAAVISFITTVKPGGTSGLHDPTGIFLDWNIYSGVLEQSRLFPQTVGRKLAALPADDPQRAKLANTIERLQIEYHETVKHTLATMEATLGTLDPMAAPLFSDMIDKLRQKHSIP